MAKVVVEVTNGFADETTRKLEIGSLETDATVATAMGLRAKVAQVNSDVSVISSLYLSEGGASFTGIKEASITITDEREINLND